MHDFESVHSHSAINTVCNNRLFVAFDHPLYSLVLARLDTFETTVTHPGTLKLCWWEEYKTNRPYAHYHLLTILNKKHKIIKKRFFYINCLYVSALSKLFLTAIFKNAFDKT